MSDYFPRIGLVLQALVENSTLVAKADALRLCAELQEADDNLNQVVEERVAARLDEITGRVKAVEDDHRVTKDVVFATDFQDAVLAGVVSGSDEDKKLRALFNGADPAAFDHDGPGGSLTKAEIVEALTAAKVEFDPKAKKADLQKLLEAQPAPEAAQEAPIEDAAVESEAAPEQTSESLVGAAQDNALSGGAGNDTV